MDSGQSGAPVNAAVMCFGLAGFLLSATWTLCRLFWGSSVVPVAAIVTEPKEACKKITRRLQELSSSAAVAESPESASPPQSLVSLEDETSLISAQAHDISAISSRGSSRPATLVNSCDPSAEDHGVQYADKLAEKLVRPARNPRTVSFSPLPTVPFPDTSSSQASPTTRPRSPNYFKRVVSPTTQQLRGSDKPQPSPPLTASMPISTTPLEPHPSLKPTPQPVSSLDGSAVHSDPSGASRSRSPTRKLRKFISLHWPTPQNATSPNTLPADVSPNNSEMKSPQPSKQSKTLRKSRSEGRHCLRGLQREAGDVPTAFDNSPPTTPQIVVSQASESTAIALPSPPLPPTPQTGSSFKTQKKKPQTPTRTRTDPYAAPYFCPIPGSPETIQHTLPPTRVKPTRRVTAPPRADSTSIEAEFGGDLRRRDVAATLPISRYSQ